MAIGKTNFPGGGGGVLTFGVETMIQDGMYIFYRESSDGKFIIITKIADAPSGGNKYPMGIGTLNASAERVCTVLSKTFVNQFNSISLNYGIANPSRVWNGSSWATAYGTSDTLYMIEVE